MKKYIFLIVFAVFCLSACRKYVEIPQIGTRVFKYTTDYTAIVNNSNTFEPAYGFPVLSGDDIDMNDPTRQTTMSDLWGRIYTWSDVYISANLGDSDWSKLFQIIYTSNEVIAGVMNSEGGTDVLKNRIYGEALVHRAYSYLSLVNLYSKQYDPSTSATDMGLPLLTTPDLYTPLNRKSVQEVYDLIITDLKTSLGKLPALPEFNVHPAKVSAYALLARTYLNTRDFAQAALYADSALSLQSSLVDFKTLTSNPALYPLRIKDPEIMLSKTILGNGYTGIGISDEVTNLLGTKDLRYVFFTSTRSLFTGVFSTAYTNRVNTRYRVNSDFTIPVGPSVPEMMLIKAECAARANQVAVAVNTINELRIRRFNTADYVPLTAANVADALVLVVNERKREFFGRGYRWMDQRRYNKDAALATTTTRTFKGASYTLAPNSNRYLYPIADSYILLNPELIQNPR